MFNTRPTKCPLCDGKVTYGFMKDFGIKPYQSGRCYICTKCGAYVGTHRNNPKEALGLLSDGKTRTLRVICHDEFDKHYSTFRGKNMLYYHLSKEMGIKKDLCHFGYMEYDELIKALEIMKQWDKSFVLK